MYENGMQHKYKTDSPPKLLVHGNVVNLTRQRQNVKSLPLSADVNVLKHCLRMRQLYSPINFENDTKYKHEIANHYKDVKIKKKMIKKIGTGSGSAIIVNKQSKRKRFVAPKPNLLSRESLQIPCFVFPRFHNINSPWKDRKKLCHKYHENDEILSETLIKIQNAQTTNQFSRLLKQLGSETTPTIFRSSPSVSGTCNGNLLSSLLFAPRLNQSQLFLKTSSLSALEGQLLSTVKQLEITTPVQFYKKKRTDAAVLIATDNQQKNHLNKTNKEWYIDLASKCYINGFQLHVNHLNGCTRQSAIGTLLQHSSQQYQRHRPHRFLRSTDSLSCLSSTVYTVALDNDKLYPYRGDINRIINLSNSVRNCDIRINCNGRKTINSNRRNLSNSSKKKQSLINCYHSIKQKSTPLNNCQQNLVTDTTLAGAAKTVINDNNMNKVAIDANIQELQLQSYHQQQQQNNNNNNLNYYQVQQQDNQFDHLHQRNPYQSDSDSANADCVNDLIKTFYSLNLAADKVILPQIILTDFSNNQPITTPLLLSPSLLPLTPPSSPLSPSLSATTKDHNGYHFLNAGNINVQYKPTDDFTPEIKTNLRFNFNDCCLPIQNEVDYQPIESMPFEHKLN